MPTQTLRIPKFSFHLVLWWFLAFGLILGTRFPIVTQIVLNGFIPLLLIMIIIRDRGIKVQGKGLILYFILLCWGCVSMLYTINMDMTLGYLHVMVGNVILWYIVSRIVMNVDSLKQLLIPLLLVFIVHAYYGIVTPITIDVSPDKEVIERAQGLTTNANGLGILLWYGIVVSAWLVLISKGFLMKAVYVGAALLLIYVLLTTGSRKCFIALILFAISFLLFANKKGNYGVFILVGLLFVLAYSTVYDFIMNHTALGARVNSDLLESGTEGRYNLITEGWKLFLSSPVVGIALGSFTSYSPSGMMAHNDYIEILASMGLPALILYLSIYFDYFRKCIYLRRYGNVPNFVIIGISFVIAFLFLGMGRPSFLDPQAIFVFAFFDSVATKLYKENILNKDYEGLSYYQHA